jgi:DNA-binding transcriptional ArsR family regulator
LRFGAVSIMRGNRGLTQINELAGDGIGAGLLHALMDGRALTMIELASMARVTPSTTSEVVTKLTSAGVVRATRQGPHCYYRLADDETARIIGSALKARSAHVIASRALVTGPRDAALRAARACYGHLAGRLGMAIADGLTAAGYVELTEDAAAVTPAGLARFADLGMDINSLAEAHGRTARAHCRPCLDWSERRPHLGGRLGAALCAHGIERRWIKRIEGTRAVALTPQGRRAFQNAFDIRVAV